MSDMFKNMFGKIASGMCRISINGGIAVKTSNGYKTYNMKTGRLTNQDNFVFDIGEDFFFVFPTNNVTKGDIILVGGKPKCVLEAEKNKITVIDYECGEIKTIIPERHVFMGNTFFYGKIVSMFGDSFMGGGKKNGLKNILKFKAMSEMFKTTPTTDGGAVIGGTANSMFGGMNPMMMAMMMGGGGFNMFDGMFDFDMGDDGDNDDDTETEDEE